MQDIQAQRLAQNETIFRRVNEHVRQAEERVSHDFPRFICECSNMDCDRRIVVPLGVYKETRRDPARFLIFPGHDLPDIENVIEEHDDFEIVEKFGPGRVEAERDAGVDR